MFRAGILGATGYTGAELIRLIAQHPELSLAWVGARESAGKPLGEVLPSVLGRRDIAELKLESFEEGDAQALAQRLDVAFTALPHAASARAGAALLSAGLRVVDLSADFRLKDRAVYEEWYGPHPAPELLETAVYGQPELHRSELRDCRLIAAPGCYPTSAILPLAPLLRAGLVSLDAQRPLIIDAKSGVSGAGKAPKSSTHLPETSEGIRPYSVAGRHRHTPEIEQELSLAAGAPVQVIFTPHLVPMTRGILSCSYLRLHPRATVEQCREVSQTFYGAGLVRVLDAGRLPDTLHVRGSAVAHIAYELDARSGVLCAFCAIDNLARGASAQAVQAFNIAVGLPEETGLPTIAQFP